MEHSQYAHPAKAWWGIYVPLNWFGIGQGNDMSPGLHQAVTEAMLTYWQMDP